MGRIFNVFQALCLAVPCLVWIGTAAPTPTSKTDISLIFSLPKDAKYEAEIKNEQLFLRFATKDEVQWNQALSKIPPSYKLLSSKNNRDISEIIFTVPGSKAFTQIFKNGQLNLILKTQEGPGTLTVSNKDALLPPPLTSQPKKEKSISQASDGADLDHTLDLKALVKGGVLTISCEWKIPVGAAIARRNNTLWVAFDHHSSPDLAQIMETSKSYVESITPYTTSNYTILCFKIPFNIHVNVNKIDKKWQITFHRRNIIPPKPSSPTVIASVDKKLRYHYPILGGTTYISFKDPDIGDEILFVPTQTLGQGYNFPSDTIDFELLPSVQGAAIIPKKSDIKLTFTPDSFDVTHPQGLMLSGNGDRAQQKRNAVSRQIFDFQKWGHFEAPWTDVKQKFQTAIIQASEKKKARARLDLAEFYVSRGQGVEALATLNYLALKAPELDKDPGFVALRGAAHYLAGHYEEAEADFLSKELIDEPEAKIWLGMCAARRKDWETAYAGLRLGRLVVARYPDTMKLPFTYLASETAYQAGALKDAEAFLNALDVEKLFSEDKDLYKLQRSKILFKQDKKDQAINLWNELINSGTRKRAQVEAAYLKASTGIAEGRISNKDAIKLLESIRYAWRGDDLEIDILYLLATLYQKDENPKEWLSLLHTIIKKYPNHPKAPHYQEELESAIERVFSDQLVKPIPPIVMLGLFRDFRNLIPNNAKGERMMDDLMDRLIKVDLLTEAAKILKRQMTIQKDPAKKADLGARLALLNVLDRRPNKALKALESSSSDQPIPPEIAQRRTYLQARILSMLQKPDEALKLLDGDNSIEAKKIQSEIYWGQKKWTEAAKALNAIEEQDPPNEKKVPTEEERKVRATRLLDYAIALYLSGQKDELAKLASEKSKFVVGTPYEATFMMVTTPQGEAVPLEQEAIKERMAQIGKFEGFVSEYRKKLETSGTTKL